MDWFRHGSWYYEMKLSISVAVAAVLVCGVIGWRFLHYEDSAIVKDFGNVLPAQELAAKFTVTNRTKRVQVFSGFEDACGVQVHMSGNGIVMPGHTEQLTLLADSQRRRGPRSAGFTLTSADGKEKINRFYEIRWNVVGGSWLSHQELWMPRDGSEVRIDAYNVPTEARLRVKASESLSAKVAGSSIFVSQKRVDEQIDSSSGAILEVIIDSERGVERFNLAAQSRARQDALYPRRVWSDGKYDVPICQVLSKEKGLRVKSSTPTLRVELRGDMVYITQCSNTVRDAVVSVMSLRGLLDTAVVSVDRSQ